MGLLHPLVAACYEAHSKRPKLFGMIMKVCNQALLFHLPAVRRPLPRIMRRGGKLGSERHAS